MSTGPAVVLITGASSGVGGACAEVLSERGHRVYGASRHPGSRASSLTPLVMDVRSEESVRQGVAAVLAAEGRIDAVVNNAGYALAGAVEDTSLAEAAAQLETNFFGALRVCRAVLPAMRRAGAGLIVNVGSIGGALGLPFQGLYSASKFALAGLSESLRYEVKPFGIRVVLIEPGDLRTNLTLNRTRATASNGGSVYRVAFERALTVIEDKEEAGAPPRAVGELLAHLLAAESPRLRYSTGHLVQRAAPFAKRWLPQGVFERLILSYHGLAAGRGGARRGG